MNTLLLTLVALSLVALNGFFVAAEFGLVKLRHTRLRAIIAKHGWRGRILAKVHGKLDAYLSACQLGITLASLGLGWIGEPAFVRLLEPLLITIPITSPELLHGISFAVAFSTISFLHIVVGELAPKSLAIRSPESIALIGAVPLYGFYWLMFPAIWLLNNSANLVLFVMGLSRSHGHDASYSSEELKFIIPSNHHIRSLFHNLFHHPPLEFGKVLSLVDKKPLKTAIKIHSSHIKKHIVVVNIAILSLPLGVGSGEVVIYLVELMIGALGHPKLVGGMKFIAVC